MFYFYTAGISAEVKMHLDEALGNLGRSLQEELQEVKADVRHVKQRLDDSKSVSISKCSVGDVQEIFQDLDLSPEVLSVPDGIQGMEVEAFVWTDYSEQSQLVKCKVYLQDNLLVPNNCVWEIVDNNKKFLSVTKESLGSKYSLHGTSDISIIDKSFWVAKMKQSGILVLFELKKKVSEEHVRQAQLELIAASAVSQCSPLVVLTDLVDDWNIYWIKDHKICIMVASRPQAFQVLSLVLEQQYQQPRPGLNLQLPGEIISRTKLVKGAYGRQATMAKAFGEEDYQDWIFSDDERLEKYEQSIRRAAAQVLPFCSYIHWVELYNLRVRFTVLWSRIDCWCKADP